jgi:hypothetical protein
VAQTSLTKKWIVRKNDQQLRDIIKLALLLEALGMPLYMSPLSLLVALSPSHPSGKLVIQAVRHV